MKRLVSAAALALALVASGAALAGPASAAANPACNTTKSVTQYVGETYVYYASIPAYSPTWTASCYINQGKTGAQVSTLQSALDHCYGENLTVDGVFGALTRAALIRVQSRVGVSADGVYGPQTGAAIEWWATIEDNAGTRHLGCAPLRATNFT